jgi:hypothetical protein
MPFFKELYIVIKKNFYLSSIYFISTLFLTNFRQKLIIELAQPISLLAFLHVQGLPSLTLANRNTLIPILVQINNLIHNLISILRIEHFRFINFFPPTKLIDPTS